MKYKNILLKTLLLTTCLSAHARMSKEAQIQSLEAALLNKMEELSELGAKIDDKYKLLESIWHDMQSHLSDQMTELGLKGEDRSKFLDQARNLSAEFFNKLKEAIGVNKNVQGFLVQELVNEDNSSLRNFGVQKFRDLRALIEKGLVGLFVEQYEQCLQEIIQLVDELEVLKNHSM